LYSGAGVTERQGVCTQAETAANCARSVLSGSDTSGFRCGLRTKVNDIRLPGGPSMGSTKMWCWPAWRTNVAFLRKCMRITASLSHDSANSRLAKPRSDVVAPGLHQPFQTTARSLGKSFSSRFLRLEIRDFARHANLQSPLAHT